MKERLNKIFVSLLLWLVLPGALLAGILYFRAGTLAVCFYAFVALIVVSRFMALFWLQPLRCERELSGDTAEIGEHVKVIVKLFNPAPWPVLWVYAEDTLPLNMSKDGVWKRLLFIPPRRSFFLTYRVTLDRRGCHQIGPLVLESGDVFGLFRKCRIEPRRDFVTALPHYSVIEEFEIGRHRRLGDMAAARSLFEDSTRIRGVREYRRGDAMKRIHWKSSARTGELRSKIYDPVVEAAATVVLDFHQQSWREARSADPALLPEEMAVQVVCSICRYLLDGGWRVGFFTNGRDPLGLAGLTLAQARAADSLGEALRAARLRRRDHRLTPIAIRARSAPDQFDVIRENLGRIELSDGLSIGRLLMGELAYIERHQALVIVSGAAGDEFIDGVIRARALGYRIMLFIVCNNVAHDRAFEELSPHGVEVYRMDEEWRLREIATGRRNV